MLEESFTSEVSSDHESRHFSQETCASVGEQTSACSYRVVDSIYQTPARFVVAGAVKSATRLAFLVPVKIDGAARRSSK